MPRIPFAKYSYVLDSVPANAQRLVNLFAEALPPDSRSDVIVRSVPGFSSFATCGSVGKIWRIIPFGDYVYVIAGDTTVKVYKVSSAGSVTLIDTIPTTRDPAIYMVASATQIAICNPPYGYIIESDVLTAISDADFPDVTSVAYVGGYFVWGVDGGEQYVVSNLLDGTAYEALDFASAETVPDGLLWVAELDNELWLFGARSIEIHHLTGGDFPFERQSGGVIDVGTISGLSVAEADGSLFWLGHDLIAYRSRGYEKERVSTYAIEREIQSFTAPQVAQGFGFTFNGHTYYVLSFADAGRTFLYDTTTGLWHERSSADVGGSPYYWDVACTCRFGKRLLVGSAGLNGGPIVSSMDGGTATENGTALIARATLPPLWADTGLAIVHRLELEMETGKNSSEKTVTLQHSDDGGQTWSTGVSRGTGASGNGTKRVVWQRGGKFRKRIYRLTFESGQKIALYGMDIRATGVKG